MSVAVRSAEPEKPIAPVPATGYEIAAYVVTVGLLVFVFLYHLVPSLLVGLLVATALAATARRLRGPRLSHGAAKVIALVLIASVVAALTMLLVFVLGSFVHGHAGDLPAVFQKMADALDVAKERLAKSGFSIASLDAIRDAADVQTAFSTWLREHAEALRKMGGGFGHFLLHVTMGILAGLLVFFRHPSENHGPFAKAMAERIRRFAEAFKMIVTAQVEISAINTAMTAVYLAGILPLTGNRLPFTGTLIAITFAAGLLPVVGNLISNTVIVVLSLGIGPLVAIGSLVFLIVVHKLEYIVNAKIVGSRVHANAWEVLIAILLFEVAFGVPGVILAPVVYAWGKRELMDRGLV